MAIITLPLFNSAVLRRSGSTVRFITNPTLAPLHSWIRSSDSDSHEIFRSKYCVRIPKLDSRELKRLAQTLNALNAAFVLVWPKSQWGLETNKANLDALSAIVHLIRWTIVSWASRGEQYVATRLKSLCDHCRFHAISSDDQLGSSPNKLDGCPWQTSGQFDPTWLFRGSIRRKAWNSKSLLRFSRASRAFPAGGSWSEKASIQKHRIAMTSEPICPPEILKKVKQVVGLVTRDVLTKPNKSFSIPLSSSASIEAPVRQGGAASHIRQQLWSRHAEVYLTAMPGTELDDEPELVEMVQEGFPYEVPRYAQLTRQSAIECSKVSSGRVVTTHRIVPIPDRGGFKTRVISSGNACLQYLAQTIRKPLYSKVLQRTPTRWALMDDGVKKWIRQLRIPPLETRQSLGDWVALSSDLSAATDLFPHDLVESINDSIESNGINEGLKPEWTAWRSLSGPQKLVYPDNTEIMSTCGNLMGTVPSWFHLNMVNLSVIRIAWSIWSIPHMRKQFPDLMRVVKIESILTDDLVDRALEAVRKLKRVFLLPQGCKLDELTAIVGDDLCAACPFGVAVLYEILIKKLNGQLSPGKHYVQPWYDGNLLLIAEEFAIITGDTLECVTAEHLRGLISIEESRDLSRPDRPGRWSQVGTVISQSVSHARESVAGRLCSLAHMHLQPLRRILLSKGLPVYLPTSIGGLGWPHPRGLKYALERTSFKCLFHYSRMRGLRSDPIAFATAIARTRSTLIEGSITSVHYSEMVRIFRDYTSDWRISRSLDGKLAQLTPDTDIGMFNPDIPCRLLSDVIDDFCKQGVAVRYLSDLKDHDNPIKNDSNLRGISHATRLYNRVVSEMQVVREGKSPFRVPRSSYVDFIREDEEYLSNLWVSLDSKKLAELFPSAPDMVPGRAHYVQDQETPEKRDTLYLAISA